MIGRRTCLAAATAVLAASAAGCTGVAGTAGVAAATAAAATASTQLTAALLTADDLPLGFRAEDGSADAAALGCAGIDGVYLTSGASARAAVSFAHSLTPAFVNETITSRPGGAAASAITAFGAAARDCARFTGPDGTAYQVSAVPLPRYGDASAAVRVTSALAEARPVELVAVRVGDTVVAVAAAGVGPEDAALTRTVVDRALAKLTGSGQ